jgi:hypothetical protein
MNKNVLCHCGRIAFLYTTVIDPITVKPLIYTNSIKHYHHNNNFDIYKCLSNHETKINSGSFPCYCDLKIFNPKK